MKNLIKRKTGSGLPYKADKEKKFIGHKFWLLSKKNAGCAGEKISGFEFTWNLNLAKPKKIESECDL